MVERNRFIIHLTGTVTKKRLIEHVKDFLDERRPLDTFFIRCCDDDEMSFQWREYMTYAEFQRHNRAGYRKERKCIRCGGDREFAVTLTCEKCLEYTRMKRREWMRNGVCVGCGKRMDGWGKDNGRYKCSTCMEGDREKWS